MQRAPRGSSQAAGATRAAGAVKGHEARDTVMTVVTALEPLQPRTR
jgi:hypothetical protein